MNIHWHIRTNARRRIPGWNKYYSARSVAFWRSTLPYRLRSISLGVDFPCRCIHGHIHTGARRRIPGRSNPHKGARTHHAGQRRTHKQDNSCLTYCNNSPNNKARRFYKTAFEYYTLWPRSLWPLFSSKKKYSFSRFWHRPRFPCGRFGAGILYPTRSGAPARHAKQSEHVPLPSFYAFPTRARIWERLPPTIRPTQ